MSPSAVPPRPGPPGPAPDEDALQDLAEQAVRLVTRWLPGASAAGVTVVHAGVPVTVASSDPRVPAVDRAQEDLGDGPCLTAVRTGAVVMTDAAQSLARWPGLAAAAREHGVRSFLAAPLMVRGVVRGSINLYSELEDGFAGDDAELVDVLAQHVSRGLAGPADLRTTREQVTHLQVAITSRAPIEQATGILMAAHRVSDAAAFEMLRERSQQTSTTLHDVAVALVDAQADGTVPGAPAPRVGVPAALDFQSAFDHAPIGMAVTDPGGVLLTVNPVLAGLLGHDRAELAGTTLFDVTHPDDVASAQATCTALRDGPGLTAVLQVRFRTADGSWAPVTVSTAKVLAGDGQAAHLVMHVEDVSDHHRLTDQLRHQALHDPLTALPNRVLLLDRLAHGAARHDRSGGALSVVFCDVDRFKEVNDTHGHHVGDAVLLALAERLRRTLRPGDTAARLGGDELVVLCEDTDAGAARAVAERIRDELSAPVEAGGTRVDVTVSVGVATSGPAQHLSPSALLEAADAAMYADKARTRAVRPHRER